MNTFQESLYHKEETMCMRKSMKENDEDMQSLKVDPTRKLSPGRCILLEADFLAEYKGASRNAYAKAITTHSCTSAEEDRLSSFQASGVAVDRKTLSLEQGKEEGEEVKRPVESNPLLAQALEELDRNLVKGDRHRMAQSWNSLGLVRLHTQLDILEAIRCHKNALQLLQSSSSSPSSSSSSSSSFSLSPHHHHSHDDARAASDSLELATTFHDLGLCYERLNDTNQAMQSYLQARDILSSENLLMESHPQIIALNRAIDRIQGIL